MFEHANESSSILIYPLLIPISFLSLVFIISIAHEILLCKPLGAVIMLGFLDYEDRWEGKNLTF